MSGASLYSCSSVEIGIVVVVVSISRAARLLGRGASEIVTYFSVIV